MTVYLLGGIALCGLGMAGIIETVFDLRRWRVTPSWPIAEGRVVYSCVDGQGVGQDDYTEKLKFKYEFSVDGRIYTGDRIRAGQELDLTISGSPGSAWSTARRDASRYPHGSRVLVRYDPRNPKRCCLQLGGLPGIFVKETFVVGLCIVGSVLIHKALG